MHPLCSRRAVIPKEATHITIIFYIQKFGCNCIVYKSVFILARPMRKNVFFI
jgi:hypothetical protein